MLLFRFIFLPLLPPMYCSSCDYIHCFMLNLLNAEQAKNTTSCVTRAPHVRPQMCKLVASAWMKVVVLACVLFAQVVGGPRTSTRKSLAERCPAAEKDKYT